MEHNGSCDHWYNKIIVNLEQLTCANHTAWTISFNSHLILMGTKVSVIPFYRWKQVGVESLRNWPKFTELIHAAARIHSQS